MLKKIILIGLVGLGLSCIVSAYIENGGHLYLHIAGLFFISVALRKIDERR